MNKSRPDQIMLVTGMSGAGKSTALNTFEDIGWEVVDNLPVALLDRLLATPFAAGAEPSRPLAIGIDSRTRGFNAADIVKRIKTMREEHGQIVSTLFLDCAGAELERRFSETRRRHPLALDRPAADGISQEREMVSQLRRWADHVIDTTNSTSNDLKHEIRIRFGVHTSHAPTLTLLSFGFARGVPRNADLMFDMRFLRNPYWEPALRAKTGQDAAVVDYIRQDPAYAQAVQKIEDLLLHLLPLYQAEGKSYITIAIGCTGGQHRSVHVAERLTASIKAAGFAPVLTHRDLGSIAADSSRGENDATAPNLRQTG